MAVSISPYAGLEPTLVPQTGPRLEPYKLTDVKVTDRVLGHGSSAVVLELEYMGLKCAGKKIHELLLGHEGPNYMIHRFEEECRLLSRLSHPNIVQFLGIYYELNALLPILVMEFLPINLTTWIDRYGILPKENSYSILHDVSLGLLYIHSQTPPIIHRDLSSNNVLLTANMTAKISDLATAKILDGSDKMHWTQCPGTHAFMAPEASKANPKYDTGIDIFAYGIMIIHVLSGKWPEAQIESVRIEPEGAMFPVSEAERRDIFLEIIGKDHPLMDLIQMCIANNPKIRPNASEIVHQLAMIDDHPITAFQEYFSMKTSKQEMKKVEGTFAELIDEIEQLSSASDTLHPFDVTNPEIDEIPGVEVCGKIRILVTSAPQLFRWKQFGLKLHIHEDSLPSEIQQCKIDIMVSLSGQYEFPEDSHCVSAIYWFRCTPVFKFQKAITLEMEHCAISVGMLCFARAICTQKHLPYKFTELQNGEFSEHSSYGILRVNSFSGITIVNKGINDKEYCARLFYMNPEIHFVITCNTEAHNTALWEDYHTNGAMPGPFQPIYFEEEEVMLDIPMNGVTVEAWTITPLIYPVVTKRQVDSYKKGKLPPCCQLHTKISPGIMIVASVYHKVTLIGAKHPHNIFTIVLPFQGSGRPVLDRNLDDPRDDSVTRPIHKEYLGPEDDISTPLGEDDLSSIMRKVITVKSRYYAVGRALGLPAGELDSIRLTNPHDPEQGLNDILLLWLRQKYNVKRFGLPTWQRLAHAIESPAGGNYPALAQSEPALHQTVYKSKHVAPSALISKDDKDLQGYILTSGQTYEKHKKSLQIGSFEYRRTLATFYLSLVDSSLWPHVKVVNFINNNLTIMQKWETVPAPHGSVRENITYDEVLNKLSQVKFILFTGQPGSGKTTFLTKLSHDWANGSLLQLELLFLVPLRQLNDYEEHTLATILHVACPLLTQEEITYLEGAIIKMKGKNMVFAFDGVDEYSTESTSDTVFQLLNVYRSFLPDALIIATSRHDEPQLFVGMRIEIQGFSTNEVFKYIYGYFVENQQKAEQVIKHLKQNVTVMNLCCIPLFCAMLAFFYDEAAVLPKNSTEFYKLFTLSFFNSAYKHKQKPCFISFSQFSFDQQEEFSKFCQLAYEASLSRKEVVTSSRVSTGKNENGFISIVSKHYFKNFSLNKFKMSLLLQFQHYLAAIYIAHLSQSKQIDVIMNDVNCPYAVYKFLCGMTVCTPSSGISVFEAIHSVVKSRSDCSEALIPCAYESKQQYPYEYLSKQWKGTFTFTSSAYSSSLTPLGCYEVAALLNAPQFKRVNFHSDFTAPKEIIKSIFAFVDNPALTVEISSSSCEGILTGVTGSNIGSISLTLKGGLYYSTDKHIQAFETGFMPRLCTKLREIRIFGGLYGDIARHLCGRLEYCVNLKILNVHGNQILNFEQFCNALHHFKHLEEIRIYCLTVDDTTLLIDGLAHCSKLSIIDFGGLQLKTFGAQLIGEKFSTNKVKELYIDDNYIGDDGLHALLPWLQSCSNLEILVLRGNYFTDESLPLLANLIRTNRRLRYLRGLYMYNFASKLKEVVLETESNVSFI